MKVDEEFKEWWEESLLGQQSTAHPAFGSDIHAQVDGDVVTLTGTVETPDEVEEVEREVERLGLVKTVVNRLTAAESGSKYRLQAVLALFPDERTAELARQATTAWTVHDDDPAEIFCRREDAERTLVPWAEAAHVPASALDKHLEAVQQGKVLFADRVREDDCLRIISALEGTNAEMIRTLPPEPESREEG